MRTVPVHGFSNPPNKTYELKKNFPLLYHSRNYPRARMPQKSANDFLCAGIEIQGVYETMRNSSGRSARVGGFCFASLLLLINFSTKAFAQGGVGTITGTVTDPKGLTVAQAKIVIKNTDTGIERPPLETSDSGNYSAAFLQPGHYEVTVDKDGFSPTVRKDLVLQVGQTLTIDVALTVGTSVSEITVTGETPFIEPDRTEVSQTVSEGLAEGLPLNGRRWQSFVFLTPGVTTDGTSGLASFHGISSLYNNSQIDGVSNQQAFFSEDRGRAIVVGYTYSLDAVKEFNVNSDVYNAEFGQAAGGHVNAVTKSGTDDIHGDLFYYLRYPALNSLDPFARTHGGNPINGACPVGTTLNTSIKGSAECITQGEHQRQQFGGSVGGPIIKDKLLYFFNYDGQRRSFPIIYTGPTTNNAASALNSMIANNCAATIFPGATATAGGTQTPVSIVGFTANDPRCAAAVNLINASTGPAPRNANQDILLGKLDYQVTTNNHLSVSFNWMNFSGINLNNSNPTQGNGSSLQNGTIVTHDRYLVGGWNSVISPSMVNDFRFQWSVDYQATNSNFSGPSVTIGSSSSSGLFSYGQPNSLPRPAFPNEHRLEFADTISYVHGNHAFKAGIDVSPIHDVLINLFNGGGIYNYNFSDAEPAGVFTAFPSTPVYESDVATLQSWIADLYNLPLSSDGATGAHTGQHYNQFFQSTDTIHPTADQGKDDFYDTDLGFFVQDTWKWRPNFTVNVGLRYDLQMVPQPPDPNQNPFAAIYTSKIYLDKSNVAPRLGISYQPTKNLVIRGGYGLFFGKTTNSTYYNTRSENGQVQQQSECDVTYVPNTGTFSSKTGPAVCAPIFPNVFFAVPGPALSAPPGVTGAAVPQVTAPAAPSALNLRGQTPKFLQPMVHEAQVGIEYQLPGNVSASATYVINRGAHLPVCNDVNLAPSTGTLTYTYGAGTFANGQSVAGGSVTVPLYTTRINTGVGIVDACESIVHSLYQGAIITVKKQFGHGFEFLANYTVAKSMDDQETSSANGTSGGTFGGNSSQTTLDPYNQQGEYADSDFDQRQKFVTSYTYMPTFRVENSILNYAANGWGIGGIVTIGSPFPVTALLSSSGPFNGGKDGGVTGGVSNNASNAAGRAPQFPRNFFRGPTQVRDVDFRVTRDFRLWQERYKLQIIAETFNLFNHTIVSTVNATAYSVSNLTLTPLSSFLSPTATSSLVNGARQMQFSAKFFF